MKTFFLTEKDYVTTKWSGGETIQLFIWPPDSNFSDRTFLFRISRATIQNMRSAFTDFTGYDRILHMLKGNCCQIFTDSSIMPEKTLQPGDQIHFPGSKKIESQGNGEDFNLIMKEGTVGYVGEFRLKGYCDFHRPALYQKTKRGCGFGLYVESGGAIVNGKNMESGDFIFILTENSEEAFDLKLDSKIETRMIEICVCW